MIKTLVILTSLWGMWGSPEGSPTPSLQDRQEVVYHQAGKASLGPRPSRWCGWYMRKKLGITPSSYNVARNWSSYGSPTHPRIGAVVVWPHHVGQIVGQNSKGQWLIESGNDGGKVRVRPWNNLHKVIAYRI